MTETLHREMTCRRPEPRPDQRHQIDIDDFKTFNDSYGHEVGDAVLCSWPKFMLGLFRESDVPCRSGGEEFHHYPPLDARGTFATCGLSSFKSASPSWLFTWASESTGAEVAHPLDWHRDVTRARAYREDLSARRGRGLYSAKSAGQQPALFVQRSIPASTVG